MADNGSESVTVLVREPVTAKGSVIHKQRESVHILLGQIGMACYAFHCQFFIIYMAPVGTPVPV